MSFTMEDSLESGWVAVRPNVFDEKEKHKFVFIVAWNEVEGKFAITCHNRTVQRRSAARNPVAEGTVCGKTAEGLLSAEVGMLEDKHNSLKTPLKEANEGGSVTKSGNGKLTADVGTESPSRGNSANNPSQVKPVRKTVGPRAKGPAGSVDMEYVDPTAIKEDLCSPESDSADLDYSETSSREHYSWAGLFSFQDMKAVHLQLCSVNSDLEPCLPAFPEEPSGMWTVLFGLPEVTHKEVEALCYQLQVYLGHALDTCGWKILSQVLFTESDDPEEYYESLSELRQKGYEEALQRAKKRLQELLEKHKATESMVELLEIYQEEDEAYGTLGEATTELYQYLLQPFRDMRELAMLRRQQIKISVENDYLGPRRIEGLQKEDADWQKKARAAVLSIQDLTVKYFEITARAQKAVYERMRVDQKKFGKGAWAAAVERMERLRHAVSKETLQLMRAKEICLEQKKHTLRQQMQGLQGGEDAMVRLDQLERQYYELQLQLYEVQFEVLRYEELLLTAQLESVRRQMIERQDEVVYYDTYESMDAMLAVDDAAPPAQPRRQDLLRLQQRARQLEARRGRITAKKAYLRNKKDICIANHNDKMQHRHGIQEDHTSQHALQQSEQTEEHKRRSQVSQERQTTLDRLRSFKQRYPGQVILKSTRLRLAYARRKSGGLSGTAVSLDQPQPLMIAAQSEETNTTSELLTSHATAMLPSQHESASLPPGGAAAPEVCPSAAPVSLQPGGELSVLVSPMLPGIPPPPPPLPPPLPPSAPPSMEPEVGGLRQPESSAREPRDQGKEAGPASAMGLVSPRFFDSSQLVNARKKLKKTSAAEASQRRRVSSPMDEVLASLKRGSFHLRKAELRVLRPDPDEDDSNNILAQIRKGVKLKKVQQRELRDSLCDAADPLTRSIHEALRRIKEASPESESEDEGLPCADWES